MRLASVSGCGFPFSDVSAWNFIADLLKNGHEVSTITLDKPIGQVAYVLLVDGYPGSPRIYVKLTMSQSKINGRSFHESVY